MFDENHRIWLEQKVKNISEVAALQKCILDKNSTYVPYSQERIHLTIFHFGVPRELYREFSLENPGLNKDEFYKILNEIFESVKDLVVEDTALSVEGFDFMGNRRNPKLAIITEAPKFLEATRSRVMTALLDLMHQINIKDPDSFIKGSSNLRYSFNRDYIPHVTLGEKGNSGVFNLFEMPFNRLEFFPSSISNLN